MISATWKQFTSYSFVVYLLTYNFNCSQDLTCAWKCYWYINICSHFYLCTHINVFYYFVDLRKIHSRLLLCPPLSYSVFQTEAKALWSIIYETYNSPASKLLLGSTAEFLKICSQIIWYVFIGRSFVVLY